MKKVFSILIAVLFLAVGCKTEVKKEEVKFKVSGMVCEIGCAKTIATKLSQQEGVLKAEVVFKDSLATVEYDANKTDKAKIMDFVKGLAGGQYKTCDLATCKNMASCGAKKQCKADCNKPCCAKKDNVCHEPVKTCEPNCTKPCCVDKSTKKEGCKANCTKPCCANKTDKKAECKANCAKPCCTDKDNKKSECKAGKKAGCKADCTKPCCADKK